MWPPPSWAENILDEFAFLILGIFILLRFSKSAFFPSSSLKKQDEREKAARDPARVAREHSDSSDVCALTAIGTELYHVLWRRACLPLPPGFPHRPHGGKGIRLYGMAPRRAAAAAEA